MKDQTCPVVYHEAVGEDYRRLGLETGYVGFVPGQFGMLEVPRRDGVLLRRAFSLARQKDGVTEILYKIVGKGTAALRDVSVGSQLRLLGPLGHGFQIPEQPGNLVGVAGGYGIAPFYEMAWQLRERGKKLVLFCGARKATDLLYREELEHLNVELHLCTEDGSVGHRGRVTEPLATYCDAERPAVLWSCGPMGLLKAVQRLARDRGIPSQLSVEESMGCGTGVCLTCVVPDRSGKFLRACCEGPVFSGEAIELEHV